MRLQKARFIRDKLECHHACFADEKALEQPRKSPGKPAQEQLNKAPKGLGKLELIHFKPYDFNVLFQVVIGRRYFCWSRDQLWH